MSPYVPYPKINIKKTLICCSFSYIIIFVGAYVCTPYLTIYELYPEYVNTLAGLTIISAIFFLVGLNISLFRKVKSIKVLLSFEKTLYFIFSLFILIVAVIIITAPNIPIIESFKGASAEELSINREDFLKTRTGWEFYLGYIIETLNAFIPYFIAVLYLKNHKYRHFFALIFFFYCISFLAKAYFFRIALPLFIVFLFKSKNKAIFIIKGTFVIIGSIAMMYFFSGSTGFDTTNDESFFSILYLPSTTTQTIIWRTFVVPIITALDSIRIFMTDFGGKFLYGDTSSFISFLKGSEKIPFERLVYQGQFGGAETGNSNSFYLIEAYINFGLVGVILFSFFVGKIIRLFILSQDIALISLLPLFILNLYSAGLMSLLIGSGWLLLILMVKTVKYKFVTP